MLDCLCCMYDLPWCSLTRKHLHILGRRPGLHPHTTSGWRGLWLEVAKQCSEHLNRDCLMQRETFRFSGNFYCTWAFPGEQVFYNTNQLTDLKNYTFLCSWMCTYSILHKLGSSSLFMGIVIESLRDFVGFHYYYYFFAVTNHALVSLCVYL